MVACCNFIVKPEEEDLIFSTNQHICGMPTPQKTEGLKHNLCFQNKKVGGSGSFYTDRGYRCLILHHAFLLLSRHLCVCMYVYVHVQLHACRHMLAGSNVEVKGCASWPGFLHECWRMQTLSLMQSRHCCEQPLSPEPPVALLTTQQ